MLSAVLPIPAAPVRIHLLRHGEVALDGPERVYGDMEMPLSARGVEQLEIAGRFFSEVQLDAVFASDIQRAVTGAQSIAKYQRGIGVQIDTGLREIFRGDWRGLTWEEIEQRWPGGAARFVTESESYRGHRGETLADVSRRAAGALDRILRNSQWREVAIVSHSWVVRVLVAHALGLPAAAALSIHGDPGKYSTIEGNPQHGWRVICINATPVAAAPDRQMPPPTATTPLPTG
jgi:broad specificity phosphatase PhoE